MSDYDIVDVLIDAVWESTAHTTLISTMTAERALSVVAPLIEASLRVENEKLREALAQLVNAAPSEFDLKVMAERDAAERKVEQLREALYPFTAPSEHYYEDFADHETLRVQLPAGWVRRARAAMKETENGD